MRELRNGAARLLVVDDNKVNRLLLTRSLELQGHSTASAENGRIALEMLRREPFDLVLLDMEMPEMDGFQVLEQLVNDRKLRDLPVIVTSSLEGIANVVRCIELGAEDYLTKPVNPVLLKARIGASLEKKHLRDQQKELVRRFATPEVAQDLQDSGFSLGGKLVHASVMFSDIRGFTALAESQPPEETIELLNTYYALMFDHAEGGRVRLVRRRHRETTLAVQNFPWRLDQAYDLKLQVEDRELCAWIDGRLMFQAQEAPDDALMGGGIALIVDTGSISTEEVRVSPL